MEPNLLLFVGRFHPLLVHLPIALVMVVALIEATAWYFKKDLPAFWLRLLLAVSALGAVGAVACGWLLASEGGYDATLLERHRWLGSAVAGLSVAALLVHALGRTVTYRVVLGATVALLGAASHLGGSLTHGTTYLTEHAPAPLRALLGEDPVRLAVTDPRQADVAADVILPVLTKGCAECHGPGKQQGDLRVDSVAALLKGGASGPAIVAGKGDASELLHRLALPEGDRKRMPPAGKPGLSYEDVALLRWWIEAGAPDHGTMASLKPPGTVKAILTARFRPTITSNPLPLADVRTQAATLSKDLGIDVTVTPVGERAEVAVNARVAERFDDAALARLAPLASVITHLNLAHTAITTAGLTALPTLPALRLLDLSQTAIDDGVAPWLANLDDLESLNVYGTKVGDPLLATLSELPKVRRVYLWRTAVTPAAAEAFAAAQTDQRRIEDLHRRIEELQREARRAVVGVDLGPAPVKPADKPTALNTVCPVSGKPVDPTIIRLVDGKPVAYCCTKCPPKNAKAP